MGRTIAQVPNEDPERLKRVLDAKYRTIGVDKDALEKQAAETRDRNAADKAKDENYAHLARYYADTLQAQQQDADRMRRENNIAVQEFRNTNQLQHTRKEWDINRPDLKQIDSAARVGDDDPRLGTASLQKFEGEDLSAGDRKAAQIEQARTWWEDQAVQKAAMRAAEAEADGAHAELVKYQDLVQQDAKAQEAYLRRQMNRTNNDINAQLAEERRLRGAQQRDAELAANMAEMDATLSSPMMTEDPNLAASALSANRVRRDHFKGMSEAEKRAVADTQLAQVEENRARRAAAAAEEAQYARTQHDVGRALSEQQRKVDDFRRAQMGKAQDFLKQQMDEKSARDKATGELYTNKIHDSYFEQFGTSHR